MSSSESRVVYRDPFQVTLDIVSGALPGVDLATLLQQYPQQIIDLVAEGAKAGGFTAKMVDEHVGDIFRDAGPEGGVLGNINLLGLLSYFTDKYNLRPLGSEAPPVSDKPQAPAPAQSRRGRPRKAAGGRAAKTAASADAPVSEQVRAYLKSTANTKRLLEAAGSVVKLATKIRSEVGIPVTDANFYWIIKRTYPEIFGKKRAKRGKR